MPVHPSLSLTDFQNPTNYDADHTPIITGFWRSLEDVPEHWYKQVKDNEYPPYYEDHITALAKGKEWLFELTCLHQPRTGQLLMEGGELVVRLDQPYDLEFGTLALEVRGKMVEIYRGYLGDNPSDVNFNPKRLSARETQLPNELTLAYYTRFVGMNLLAESCFDGHSHALPKHIRSWPTLSSYIKEFGMDVESQMRWFDHRFPELVPPKEYNGAYVNFACWIDTRLATTVRPLTPAEQRTKDRNDPIDALFMRRDVPDTPIYHVIDCNLKEMRVLNNPAEAVDLYCEHVLLGREERFDFVEHGRALD